GDGAGHFNPLLFQSFAVGVNPLSFALGDFNADGKIDLATANGNETVSVLTNVSPAPGSFVFGLTPLGLTTAPPSSPCKPLSIAAGDFRNDARPDLVVGCSNTMDVRYLNNAAGVFAAIATSWATSPSVSSLAVADFNDDGDPDVAAASDPTGQVAILLGRGDGTFQGQVPYAVAGQPARVASLDLNRDSRPDLVTANNTRGTVSLLTDTNCTQRRMDVGVQPSACNIAGVPFSP